VIEMDNKADVRRKMKKKNAQLFVKIEFNVTDCWRKEKERE
jgi:hypothetical protein